MSSALTGPLTLELPPETAALVREQVERGRFPSAEEAVGEAMRLLDDHKRHEELLAALQIGREQIGRGEFREWTPELRAELWESARRRFEAGEKPHPDVLP